MMFIHYFISPECIHSIYNVHLYMRENESKGQVRIWPTGCYRYRHYGYWGCSWYSRYWGIWGARVFRCSGYKRYRWSLTRRIPWAPRIYTYIGFSTNWFFPKKMNLPQNLTPHHMSFQVKSTLRKNIFFSFRSLFLYYQVTTTSLV